jgi:lipoate-protein ligase A
MININDYLENNITSIKSIVAEFDIDKEFSSHDFIEKFTEKFEEDYIEMLVSYQKSGKAFQTVHKLIAKYLSLNMTDLEIEKTQKKQSENVKGNLGIIQWWIRKA